MSGRRSFTLDELGAELALEYQQQTERKPISKQPRKPARKQPERVFTPARRSSSPPQPAVCWRCAKPARPDGPSCSACLAGFAQRQQAELRARFEAAERWRGRDAR